MVEPNHVHSAGCNCAEEEKQKDPQGVDLYDYVEITGLECFNAKTAGSITKTLRRFDDKHKFLQDATLSTESDYATELVVMIPFAGEIKLKSICVAGGVDGRAPSKMKVYKNEECCDFNIIEDKKPVMTIDLAENPLGEIDYPVNLSKFNNCTNIVLGFEENFGGNNTLINFIGLKGQLLRAKTKAQEFVYESRAQLADHKTPNDVKA